MSQSLNTKNVHFDITLVGLGLAGKVLALSLSKLSKKYPLKILAIDKDSIFDQTLPDSRAIVLNNVTVDYLNELNALSADYINQAIQNVQISSQTLNNQLNLSTQDNDFITKVFNAKDLIHSLNTELKKQVDNKTIEVLFGEPIKQLNRTHQGYELTFQNHHKINTKLLIACDGSNSPISQWLKNEPKATTQSKLVKIANLELDPTKSYQNNFAYIHFLKNYGHLALVPNFDYITLVYLTNKNHQKSELETITQLKKIKQNFDFKTIDWIAQYELEPFIAEQIILPHFISFGDAAHSLIPLGGQGFNLSVLSAICLSNYFIDCLENKQNYSEYKSLLNYEKKVALYIKKVFNTVELLDKTLHNNKLNFIFDQSFKYLNQQSNIKQQILQQMDGSLAKSELNKLKNRYSQWTI